MITLFYKLRTFETLPSDKNDRRSKFAIYLNNELIGLVASPIHDGARVLLQLGFDPDTLLTTQAVDSDFPSWKPQPLSHWAKSTVKERDSTGLAVEPFIQFPGVPVLPSFEASQVSTYPEVPTADVCVSAGISEGVSP